MTINKKMIFKGERPFWLAYGFAFITFFMVMSWHYSDPGDYLDKTSACHRRWSSTKESDLKREASSYDRRLPHLSSAINALDGLEYASEEFPSFNQFNLIKKEHPQALRSSIADFDKAWIEAAKYKSDLDHAYGSMLNEFPKADEKVLTFSEVIKDRRKEIAENRDALTKQMSTYRLNMRELYRAANNLRIERKQLDDWPALTDIKRWRILSQSSASSYCMPDGLEKAVVSWRLGTPS